MISGSRARSVERVVHSTRNDGARVNGSVDRFNQSVHPIYSPVSVVKPLPPHPIVSSRDGRGLLFGGNLARRRTSTGSSTLTTRRHSTVEGIETSRPADRFPSRTSFVAPKMPACAEFRVESRRPQARGSAGRSVGHRPGEVIFLYPLFVSFACINWTETVTAPRRTPPETR